MTFKAALERVVGRLDLDRGEASEVMGSLMTGELEDSQIGGLLVALRMKGVVASELAGFAEAMRKNATPLEHSFQDLVDTCGTGGGPATFNLSTGAAIVAAAAGARVAKHGNRAVTSKCGSADVLEALGVDIGLRPEQLVAQLEKARITFMFAPNHHPAMRFAGPSRKALGVRTVFNQLGPLANPAGAANQLVGVYDAALIEPMADALSLLGAHRAMVVHSAEGMDEISPCGVTEAGVVEDGKVKRMRLEPSTFGLDPLPWEALEPGADVGANAEILKQALTDADSLRSRALVPNAATALFLAGAAPSLEEGAVAALNAVRSGQAAKTLEGPCCLDILSRILEHKRNDLESAKAVLPLNEAKARAADAPATIGFRQALEDSPHRTALIAEVKKASPVSGVVRENFDPVEIATDYKVAGADCLSVLTDREFFQGRPEYLAQCRQATGLPTLRKDFTVDEYDVWVSRALSADAVLLIVAGLEPSSLKEYRELAESLGMAVIVEAHSLQEAETALESGAKIVGVNNRDLVTFETAIGASEDVIPRIVDRAMVVSESALETSEDVARVSAVGARAVLIGTSFCKAPDIKAKVREVMDW